MSRDETTNGRFIDHLLDFIGDPEDEVASMSREEIRAYLKDEGIELDAVYQDLRKRMSAISGRQRLADAKRRKDEFAEKISNVAADSKDTIADVRSEIARRLAITGDGLRPAHAYFRRLQEATEDDLRSMLDDLRVLDEADKGEGA